MNETITSKINIIGTGISNVDLEETIAYFSDWIEQQEKKRVCVTPVNCLVWAGKNSHLQQVYNSADLTLCDGVPLIWASRFLGNGVLKGRVTGLDLLPTFTETCHTKNYSMFFLGGAASTLQKVRSKLEEKYPGIRITGSYSPPYATVFSEEENQKILSLIAAAKPDILWVSLTAPKQDLWIYEHFSELQTKIAIGIGGALDVMAGNISRAPVFMQKNGLEWLYRLYKEPRRLFRRYLVEAPAFLPALLKQKWSQ